MRQGLFVVTRWLARSFVRSFVRSYVWLAGCRGLGQIAIIMNYELNVIGVALSIKYSPPTETRHYHRRHHYTILYSNHSICHCIFYIYDLHSNSNSSMPMATCYQLANEHKIERKTNERMNERTNERTATEWEEMRAKTNDHNRALTR